MGVGQRIKVLASIQHISLAELARRLGKTKQAMYEIILKEDVNTSIIRKLSHEFQVPITFFFDDDNSVYTDIRSNQDKEKIVSLEEKIALLENTIKDKERLIQILMKKEKS